MKKILILAAVCFAFAASASAQFRTDRPGMRDENRRERQGIRNGSITRGEAIRIEKQQRDYRRAVVGARADGYVSPRERANIRRQDRQVDRTIFRTKRNCNRRG